MFVYIVLVTKFLRRPDQRPAEILDAALDCFVARSFAATRVEDLAAAAGVTVGTVYRYFPSKDALVAALVERHLDTSWSRGSEIAAAYGSLQAREIVALLLNRWALSLEQPAAAAILMVIIREAPQFPDAAKTYAAQLRSGIVAIERALRHGVDRGEFPLLDVSATAHALAAAVIEGTVLEHTFGAALGPSKAGARVRGAIDLMVRGLPRSPGPAPGKVAPIPQSSQPESPATAAEVVNGNRLLRVVTLTPPRRNT